MRAMTATDACDNSAAVLDAATEDDDEVIITRSGGREPAVVFSLREDEAMRETAYLLSSRTNACRLAESIDNVRAGRIRARVPDF
ncbi:type II toxin-antitoxin system Phd/YefM family antitoxin [Nocardia carnea]|uniref:type II toxin-antitoxin system Phd/YefM family antitoxin n=1 Tax=Nocardia carnea TaxID=37328 RepID=UPI00245830AA|nr:type II toxin-antitoxin system prevent-host-death family antitoxin [Nocardia carnea]